MEETCHDCIYFDKDSFYQNNEDGLFYALCKKLEYMICHFNPCEYFEQKTKEKSMISIDADHDSDKGNCRHHCSPSCHPEQTGHDWKYACRHPAWPQNRAKDFPPIVDCNGKKNKCELVGKRFIGRYVGGLKRRINNADNKTIRFRHELSEMRELLNGNN